MTILFKSVSNKQKLFNCLWQFYFEVSQINKTYLIDDDNFI